jgi:hypothetical protein
VISPRNTEKLQDLLAPYLPAAVRAWVDGLKACKPIWSPETHRFEETDIPDHKIRADCAQKIVEYVVGKAIERSMEVSGSYKELSTLLDELKQSPEAQRLLPASLFESLLSTTEGKESSPLQPDSEQKTG